MDIHTLDGPVQLSDVAISHAAELQAQAGHDVQYLRYPRCPGVARVG